MEANSAAMLTKSSSPFVIDSVERLDEGAAKEEIGPGQAITTSVDCWSRFHQWFHCFCVVTFDLELGQTIEVVYPGDAPFSAQERSDLCYASFPDSNSTASPSHGHSPILKKGHLSSEQGPSDSMHHFRIRRTSLNEQNNPSNLEEFVPASLLPDPRFFHCVSFFRRQRDTCLPRGYFQKSIVLVSILPFVPFFQRILSEVAFAFFANGETAIETVCFQIDRHWPPPTSVGCELSLPLFGHHFQYTIPAEIRQFKLGSNMTPKCEKLLLFSDDREISGSSADDVVGLSDDNNNKNVIEAAEQQFHEVIRLLQPHLQLIWELVLLGEPLLIVAPTASLSSTLVNALVSLIKPLRYCGDYRPFFTIHDSDFTELSVRQNCCVNNFVLGVTNPFFLKAFAHWPHILRIGPYFTTNSLLRSPQRNSDGSEWQTETENDNGGEGLQNERREIERIFIVRTQKTIKRLSNHAHFDRQNMGGLLSTHRQFLVMDKLLTRNLHKMSNDFASQWHLLKRHFAKLTQSFISPLERFIASLLPLRSHLCPFQPVPSMRSFSLDHFLSTLQHFGHPGVKGDWQGLYRQFVTRSPNFIGWLQQRRKHIERQLNEEYLELLCTANLSSGVLRQRSQVEIVDLVLKFRDRLAELEQYCSKEEQLDQHKKQRRIFSLSPMKKLSVVDRQRKQLQQQLNCILSLVDDELKNLLMSNNTLRRAVIKNMDDHRNQCS